MDRSPLSRLSTRDKRAPRTRSLVVIPRQLVKAASAPLELDPPSTRTFRCRATNEPEMRLADFCNPHVKDEHPMNRVASGFVSRGPPISPEDGAYTQRPPALARIPPPRQESYSR